MGNRGVRWRQTTKDLAEFARLGLRFGLLAPTSVTAWADGVIAKGDIPEPWLIDLALATEPDTLEDALRHVPGEPQADLAICLLLAQAQRQWRLGRLSIGNVRRIGWWLHCESALPTPDGKPDWGVRLEVEGEQLDEGWYTEDDLRESIDEKLAAYSDLVTSLPSWA